MGIFFHNMIVFEYADPVCVSLLFVERVGRSPGSIFCSISLEVSWHSFSKEFPHVSSVSIFEGSIPLFLKAFRALCCLKSGVVPFFQKTSDARLRKTGTRWSGIRRSAKFCSRRRSRTRFRRLLGQRDTHKGHSHQRLFSQPAAVFF